jgi:hypothetical protein
MKSEIHTLESLTKNKCTKILSEYQQSEFWAENQDFADENPNFPGTALFRKLIFCLTLTRSIFGRILM